MTRQTSIQLTDETQAQIDALTDRGFGTQSNIIRTAVKRMFQEEIQTMNKQIADGTFTPEKLARLVAEASTRGEWYDGENSTNILEWIEEGDYSGDETIASLAAEWDE